MSVTEHAVKRAAGESAAAVGLSLLNGFQVRADGRAVDLTPGGERVVGFLALEGRPVDRLRVAGLLWTDASEARANACLRTSLWRLGSIAHTLVDTRNGRLALAPGVDVDLTLMASLGRAMLAGTAPAEAVATLRDAGDLLPDWYDDWVTLEREHFRQLRLQALEAACKTLRAQGRYGEAAEAGMAAVASEPLRESAHRALVRLHLAQGNAAEAVRQYRLCRTLLRDRLGLVPSPAMEAAIAPAGVVTSL
jgi:DNA-binding SARP family transcriptional activator